MKPERFPLSWPQGYQVTEKRNLSKFKCTFADARDSMINELKLLIGISKVKDIIISTNMPHDKKGFLNGKSPLIYPNPGVAVYFEFKGEEKVIACDAWKNLHENLRAIQYTVKALRSLERHKCTDILSRAMGDMKALPQNAGINNAAWWQILNVDQFADMGTINDAYKRMIKHYHPDKVNGNTEMFVLIQQAYEQAKTFSTIR